MRKAYVRRTGGQVMIGRLLLALLVGNIVWLLYAERSEAIAAAPLKDCAEEMKFHSGEDGLLTLNCMARSDWLLFTGSSTGEGYRVRWTARTKDYPYTGVIAAGPRFKSAVVPEKAPMATASMAKDGKWPLELRAEPKGSSESTLTLVVHFGTKEQSDRRKTVVSSG